MLLLVNVVISSLIFWQLLQFHFLDQTCSPAKWCTEQCLVLKILQQWHRKYTHTLIILVSPTSLVFFASSHAVWWALLVLSTSLLLSWSVGREGCPTNRPGSLTGFSWLAGFGGLLAGFWWTEVALASWVKIKQVCVRWLNGLLWSLTKIRLEFLWNVLWWCDIWCFLTISI